MFARRGPQSILREAARLCLLLFAVSVVTFLLVGALVNNVDRWTWA